MIRNRRLRAAPLTGFAFRRNAGFEAQETCTGFGDTLQLGRAEIRHGQVEPALDLPISLLGKTDRAGLCDPFVSGARILTPSPIRSPSALLDDIADVDADPVEPMRLSGRQAGVALGHAELDSMAQRTASTTLRVLDEYAVASALDDAAAVDGDRRVDEVAAQCAQPGRRISSSHTLASWL